HQERAGRQAQIQISHGLSISKGFAKSLERYGTCGHRWRLSVRRQESHGWSPLLCPGLLLALEFARQDGHNHGYQRNDQRDGVGVLGEAFFGVTECFYGKQRDSWRDE